MFIVIFCCLVILFLFISKPIIAFFIYPLCVFCDVFFKNKKLLRAFSLITCLIAAIGLIIFSVVLAYNLTPEILEYIK